VALALDGDELIFVSGLDAEPSTTDFEAKPSAFCCGGLFAARSRSRSRRLDPAANTKLMGLYRTGSALHSMRGGGFRRITYFRSP
jgi:aminopeptidase N